MINQEQYADSLELARLVLYALRIQSVAAASTTEDAEDIVSILKEFQHEVEDEVREELANGASKIRYEAALSEAQYSAQLNSQDYTELFSKLLAVHSSMSGDLIKDYYYKLLSEYASSLGVDLATITPKFPD